MSKAMARMGILLVPGTYAGRRPSSTGKVPGPRHNAGFATVRTLFEAASAEHVQHVIEVGDPACLANIHRRNAAKPSGAPPGPDEGFRRELHRPP
jgi:hypothetical protein